MTRLDRYVASESTKQRLGFFKMRLRLFANSAVLDRYVSVPERGECVVPRRKLSNVAQGAPYRLAHRSGPSRLRRAAESTSKAGQWGRLKVSHSVRRSMSAAASSPSP